MSSGSTASARAIATRLRMPPDSSPGSWSSVPASSTCSRTRRVMAAISAGAWRPYSRRRNPTFSATVSEARSAEDWKTMAMRKGFSSGGRARYSPSSIPPTVMRPASGRSRPTICRSSTDFPVPLWPTMASSSPGATRRSTPASTTCSPYAFRTPASSTETPCRRSAAGLAILGGCRGNHGGCGERSGGCERRGRSSFLRRAFRHASSVVAALAALAPRLVRLAHHDYPDGLLEPVRTAAVVVTWEGGATTDRCVASVLAQDRPADEVILVDNASSEPERARLGAAHHGRPGVRLLLLDENRQFAGGLNAGAEAAIAAGAERLLLLNNDTVLAPDALGRLAAALDARPRAGIAGPRLMDLREPARELSAGERHILPLLCLPRTWLRYRPRTPAPYPVTGVMGTALLVTRACYQAVGGFDAEIEVYYEDVDFCLAARARGFEIVIEPRALVYHDGLRGFAGGLTPWAAFLKARNPWLVVRRRGRAADWLGFVPTYAAMLGGSAALHALRGRGDVVRALARGALAGIGAAAGRRVTPVGPPGGSR